MAGLTAEQKEKNRAYQKKWRARRTANGGCLICGEQTQKWREGSIKRAGRHKALCPACEERRAQGIRADKNYNRRLGCCLDCGAALDPQSTSPKCAACRAITTAATREAKARRAQSGECLRCARSLDIAYPDGKRKKHCPDCLRIIIAGCLARRERLKAEGTCTACGQMPAPSFRRTCAACAAKLMAGCRRYRAKKAQNKPPAKRRKRARPKGGIADMMRIMKKSQSEETAGAGL